MSKLAKPRETASFKTRFYTYKRYRTAFMLLILDFDGVLFDDKEFKADYAAVFGALGVAPEVYEKTYRKTKADANGMYSPRRHLRILRTLNPRLRASDVQKRVEELVSKSRRYVFADAVPFLRAASKTAKLCLITTGDAFQRTKIDESGLKGFFERVEVVATGSKVAAIKKIFNRYPPQAVVFVDDKKEVAEEVKERLPKIKVVQIVRSASGEASKSVDAHARSLAQAGRLLSSL